MFLVEHFKSPASAIVIQRIERQRGFAIFKDLTPGF